MLVYLPIAEMAVPAEAVLLLGGVAGFLSGIFGVGGGFLATPLLMFMGVPPAIAVGTQANQLVSTSLSGVLGHFRRGHVDVKLAAVLLGGSMAGTVLGSLIFKILLYVGQINLVIPLLYVVLLAVVGLVMLFETIGALLHKGSASEKILAPWHNRTFFKSLPYKIHFPRSQLHISVLLPAGIGFLGGLIISIMGIGGGFLMVPLMIYVLGMPTILVAGTSLLQILMTTAVTTVIHASANHSVDVVLAVLMIVGGMAGVEVGVRLARRLNGTYARLALAVLLLLVSFQIGRGLLVEPADLYEIAIGAGA
ncbi:MAG: sulfite exporter TauE/SafE family protein [Micavibrio aeruginosavorus]|uniref:Probable membrane transporter protein n=1 Tax=Micavibrio aeruginosavorus TaxID=349221 RepID=A0A7T5R1B8_9BACT|nr:MAG: sulfite exporter TauE/SafE family protein [Micavibrio aeruginosavorus]